MADVLIPAHPLEPFRAAFAALSAELGPARLLVALEPDSTREAALSLRLPATVAALGAAADALGRALPVEPGTWSPLDGEPTPSRRPAPPTGTRAHRLGPDEWLVTGPADDPAAASGWERRLTAALRPHGGCAVDVSAQRTCLRLAGTETRGLLAFGCSLDLRPRAFGPGACAQTVLWQAPVLLAADDDGVAVLVRPSVAGHLAGRLLDAALELRADPARPLPGHPLAARTAVPTPRVAERRPA